MNVNSNETSLMMMVNSLQKTLEQQKKIFLKQNEVIGKMNENLESAIIRYEIAESIIKKQEELIDTLKRIITNGYMQDMQ
jgi:hypothetical protein